MRPKVVAFRGKIKCKKYPKAVRNFMTKEQQMHICKLCEQQGIKSATKQMKTGARVAAPKELMWGRNRGNPVVTHWALSAKHKENGWLIGLSRGEINTSCVDDGKCVICTSVQTVHISDHSSLPVVKTKLELDSHADTCVVGDHCLIVHDHNRPVNVYRYDPKVGSKHVCIVDAAVAYTEPKTGQVVILLLN